MQMTNYTVHTKRGKAWENVCERDTIGFGFTPDWMKRWRGFYKPIT